MYNIHHVQLQKEFSEIILKSALFGAVVGFVGTGAGFFVRDNFEKMCKGALVGFIIFPIFFGKSFLLQEVEL